MIRLLTLVFAILAILAFIVFLFVGAGFSLLFYDSPQATATVFVSAALLLWWLVRWRSVNASLRRFAIGVVVLIALFDATIGGVQAYVGYQRRFNIWWKPRAEIEGYLRGQTPLGTAEADVVRWLMMRGISATIHRQTITPSRDRRDYPDNRTGGEAWMGAVLDRHDGLPFVTAVEVFYTFDGEGHLIDIGVRKTVDAL